MGNVASFDFFDKFSMSAWVYPRGGGTILSKMTDTDRADGYNFRLHEGKLQVNLVKRWLDDALRVESTTPLQPDRWHHVLFTYDGSRVASGVQIYVDGERMPITVLLDELNQTFTTKEPFRIGGGGGPGERFHGLIDDVRVFGKVIEPADAAVLAVPETVEQILDIPPDGRTANQSRKLERCFLESYARKEIQSAYARAEQAKARRAALWESVPTCMGATCPPSCRR
jgi:hypothetical protein